MVTRFLSELDERSSDALFEMATQRRVPMGQKLFSEGDRASSAFVVLDGLVLVSMLSSEGGEHVLELRGPKEIVGELGAIDGTVRSATARVLEDATLLVLAADDLWRLLGTNALLARHLLVALAGRVRESAQRQVDLGSSAVVPRVARRLVDLMELRENASEFDSPLSQQQLATWAGVSRDGVVRALTQLRADSVVETGRQRFVIHDVPRLRALAGLSGSLLPPVAPARSTQADD
jgi:CRP/FNR family transcriptional regulator, cyclic AMP receptor protein